MQIQIKQAEIVTALTGYIAAQGINLVNKKVTIDFTAGRKASGLSAEISIEDDALGVLDETNQPVVLETPSIHPVQPVDAVGVVNLEPDEELTPVIEVAKTNSLFS